MRFLTYYRQIFCSINFQFALLFFTLLYALARIRKGNFIKNLFIGYIGINFILCFALCIFPNFAKSFILKLFSVVTK